MITIAINSPEYNYIYDKYDVQKNNHLIDLLLKEKDNWPEHSEHIDKLVALLRDYNNKSWNSYTYKQNNNK